MNGYGVHEKGPTPRNRNGVCMAGIELGRTISRTGSLLEGTLTKHMGINAIL